MYRCTDVHLYRCTDVLLHACALPHSLAVHVHVHVHAGAPRRPRDEAEATEMANAVWRAIWPVERIQQRAFFNFGMDVLLSLNLHEMRDFFK